MRWIVETRSTGLGGRLDNAVQTPGKGIWREGAHLVVVVSGRRVAFEASRSLSVCTGRETSSGTRIVNSVAMRRWIWTTLSRSVARAREVVMNGL